MTIDWNKVIKDVDEGTKVIPAGDYTVRVTAANAVTASTGAPMIKTTVRVEDEPYVGRTVQTNLVFTLDNPMAMKMLFRRLAALGVTAEWLAETSATPDMIAQAIMGRSTIARLNVRTYKGEERNDVEMFLDSPGSGIPMTGPMAVGVADGPPPTPSLEGLESTASVPKGPEPF